MHKVGDVLRFPKKPRTYFGVIRVTGDGYEMTTLTKKKTANGEVFVTKGGSTVYLLRKTQADSKYRVGHQAKGFALSAVLPAFEEGTMKMPESIRQELDVIDASLSPENLSCDGELPRSEVRKRYNSLTKRRSEILLELGFWVEPQY